MIKDVHFGIPPFIQVGLANGQFERIGGVIRDTQSKKVVAWLREMPTSTNNPTDMLGLGAVSMAKFGGLINLGMVAANMVVINQRLDAFSNQLEDLKSTTKAEFNRDREAEFRAALETAAGVSTSQNETTKRQLAAEALHSLLKSVESFIDLTEECIATSPLIANVYFSQAVNASTACVCCNLEIQEFDTARQYLGKHLNRFEPLSRRLVEKTLGEHPALYFHPDMQREEVERFLTIENWVSPRSTIDIIDEVRRDFWNNGILQENRWAKIPNPFNKRSDDRHTQLAQNLAQAELIIENLKRLQGFEIEIRFLRLSGQSLDSWNHTLDGYVDEETSPLAVIELEEPILIHNLSDI